MYRPLWTFKYYCVQTHPYGDFDGYENCFALLDITFGAYRTLIYVIVKYFNQKCLQNIFILYIYIFFDDYVFVWPAQGSKNVIHTCGMIIKLLKLETDDDLREEEDLVYI